jgi:ATP-dependent protease ClpP protease subunit
MDITVIDVLTLQIDILTLQIGSAGSAGHALFSQGNISNRCIMWVWRQHVDRPL